MWNTLIAAVKTKVLESNEVNNAYVYEYRRSTFDGFPAVTISPAGIGNNVFADTERNRRTYVVSIRVYQERPEQSDPEAERIVRTIADDLITLFDADIYLGAALQGRGFVKPIPGNYLPPPNNAEGPDVIGLEILLEAEVIQ